MSVTWHNSASQTIGPLQQRPIGRPLASHVLWQPWQAAGLPQGRYGTQLIPGVPASPFVPLGSATVGPLSRRVPPYR